VRAKIDVQVTSTPGTGANVVAKITGERPEQIVMGAHYDTWFAGSTDNGGGVAELIDIATRRVAHGKPKYTLVFVAYDGEEIGLYGGYDYLRKHDVVAKEPILAVLNFETPSAIDADIIGLVHSNQPALDLALQNGHLRGLYEVYAGLEIVAQLFGGIIPTDIQGDYRSGVPTVSTAATNPFYHTVKDLPDQVDLTLLANSSDDFDSALDFMFADEPNDFAVVDPQLWQAAVTTTPGGMLAVDATFTDANGAPQANAIATAAVMYDDFQLATRVTAMTDANGHAQLLVPNDATTMGQGNRFLHVTGGPTYPLVEKIISLP
jgi:Zn-dependent M28 family amino/carboxypeptidase